MPLSPEERNFTGDVISIVLIGGFILALIVGVGWIVVSAILTLV